MKMQMKLLGCCTLVVLFLLSACASSKITGEWKDPEVGGKKYASILVIGVAKQPDRRKFYEDEFAKQLSRQGVIAIASHTIIPRDKMQDKDTIVKSIEGLRVDGVIVTRLQGIKEQKQVPHGKTYQVPYGYYNNMYDYYNNSFSSAPSRSYAETHEYLQLESNLYDAETEKLVYSITTDTFIRQKFESRITAYIGTVVRQLQSNKLL
ncbi:MAG: hypothetical protein AMJ60_04350 [Desulfobacterales bacterium SG8_35]|nr:MAG: hypothetical protein AMJ60_04350 [Desulfobacterales bacterium SG8_35]